MKRALLLSFWSLASAAVEPAKTPTAPSAAEILKKIEATPQVKEQDKPFEVAASLGRLYFEQGRYAEAAGYYRQAMNKIEPTRALYLKLAKRIASKSLPPAASVGCLASTENTVAKLHETTLMLEKRDVLSAASCAASALQPLRDVEVKFGDAQFLTGDSKGALESYSRALTTFESNALARYARGALLLDSQGDDLKSLTLAKSDLDRVITEQPSLPQLPQAKRLLELTTKALAAGGTSKLKPEKSAAPVRAPGMPPVISPEVASAFQNTPRTPEMNENFAKLVEQAEDYLAQNKFDEALGNYKQVMPYQPENARLRAGMAWTMVKLNRQPMADNVWRVASQHPEAIDALAESLKQKGNTDGAQGVVARLKQTVPQYQVKTSVP
jgi:tetratricopeptide (TPR) repeat protein